MRRSSCRTPTKVILFRRVPTIMLAPRANMVDERIWENPALFHPDRFEEKQNMSASEERTSSSNSVNVTQHLTADQKTSFMPFGHGKHLCPGREFARRSCLLFAVAVILAFEFAMPNGTQRIPLTKAQPGLLEFSARPAKDTVVLMRKIDSCDHLQWR